MIYCKVAPLRAVFINTTYAPSLKVANKVNKNSGELISIRDIPVPLPTPNLDNPFATRFDCKCISRYVYFSSIPLSKSLI